MSKREMNIVVINEYGSVISSSKRMRTGQKIILIDFSKCFSPCDISIARVIKYHTKGKFLETCEYIANVNF